MLVPHGTKALQLHKMKRLLNLAMVVALLVLVVIETTACHTGSSRTPSSSTFSTQFKSTLNDDSISPPLVPFINSMVLTKCLSTPAGMTQDQQIFIVWSLDATEEKIKSATTSSEIHNRLY